MKINYSLTYVLEYVPARYVGLNAKQQQDRKAVWNFKDGVCPDELKQQILDKISPLVAGKESSTIICFLPASKRAKTLRRYSGLADYLRSHLACEVSMDAIVNAYDTESGYQNGKTNAPTENMTFRRDIVAGKRVILVDDVITRGLTFSTAADKLMAAGAISVQGVFLARTIHPDLPIREKSSLSYGENDWMYENDLLDQELMNEIAQVDMEQAEMMEEYKQAVIEDLMFEEEIRQEMMADQVYWEDIIR